MRQEYSKHDIRKPKKSHKRLILSIILAVELLMTTAACYVIFDISWDHIMQTRGLAAASVLSQLDEKPFRSDMKSILKKVDERIIEEKEEEVWTTDSVNYRNGPGTDYKRVGTLNSFDKILRTATTNNKWSRVVIDDKEYYVSSEFLTTEMPLITEGGKKGEYQRYALSQLSNYGWDETEIIPLIKLWNRESGWNPSSHNKKSGAHGIPQALPASKMASEGSDYYTNGNTQIRWGLGYISRRYGSPSAAWNHFTSKGWY